MKPLSEVGGWLEEIYGLNLSVMGTGALERVVTRRVREGGFLGISDYVRFWRESPEERDLLLQEMLVSETWFFREPPAFEVMKQWLLQRMSRWMSGERLRILVLPCASGEEAWSVASVVHALGIPSHQVEIEAMDVNVSALALARSGRYPLRKTRESGPMHQIGPLVNGIIEVDPALRPLVRFEAVNAMDHAMFVSRQIYDLIFCRNLLIYMGPSARLRVFKTLSTRLSNEGLLFLGHAEQPPPDQGWQRLRIRGAFAWHRGAPGPLEMLEIRSHEGHREGD